ncbi:LSU ribosomal protein L34p, partial [uncultured Microcoleus sp.]
DTANSARNQPQKKKNIGFSRQNAHRNRSIGNQSPPQQRSPPPRSL